MAGPYLAFLSLSKKIEVVMYQFMILALTFLIYVVSPEAPSTPVEASKYVIKPSKSSVASELMTRDYVAIDYDGPKTDKISTPVVVSPSTKAVSLGGAVSTPQAVEVVVQEPQQVKQVQQVVEEAVVPVLSYVDDADNLLKRYVNSAGGVDYDGLKQASGELDRVAAGLRKAYNPSMGGNEGLAYYINLYNVHTLKLIIDNYPVASIKGLHGGQPWKHKWIDLGGTMYSLDHIEHTVIRPTYNDPRIHFAVNCAAATCPPLLNAAYRAATVDDQLESQTRKFINNKAYNQITSDALKLSKIFKWYGDDFAAEGVVPFIDRYTDVNISAQASIDYLDYDWALNKQ
jgi:hypothetical protein